MRKKVLYLIAVITLLVPACKTDQIRPDRQLRFIAMADSRGTDVGVNSTELAKFVNLIVELTPRPEFIIFPGDLVQTGQADNLAHWQQIMKPITAAGIAIYPVPGNHEIKSGPAIGQDAFTAAFELPANGPAGYTELCYSFEVDDLVFIAGLDSSYFDNAQGQFLDNQITAPQRDWLSRRLAASRARYKFVFAHAPAYPTGAHLQTSLDAFPLDRDAFWQILDDADVTAYFCGHEHNYSRRLIDSGVDSRWFNPIHQLVVGSCGAPLAAVQKTPCDYFMAVYHMCIVDLNPKTAEFTVVNDAGQLLDRFHVNR